MLVPPSVSFALILKKKEKDLEEVNKTLAYVSNKFYEANKSVIEQTRILKSREFVLNFLSEHLDKKTTKSYFSCVAFKSSYTPIMSLIEKKSAEGLDCRVVGVVPKGNHYVVKKYKALGAKVKTLDKEIAPIRFALFDKKYVSVTMLDEYKEYVTIWSNDEQIIQTFLDLFNSYWSIGK